MNVSRRAFLGAGAAATVVTLEQLRPKSASAQFWQRNRNAVNLYSSRHYDTDDSLYRNFQDATGIQVNLVEAAADQLIERIKGEGASSQSSGLADHRRRRSLVAGRTAKLV